MFFLPFSGQKEIQKDIYESLIVLDDKLRWLKEGSKEFKTLWNEREELFEWRNWVRCNMGWYSFEPKKPPEERYLSFYD